MKKKILIIGVDGLSNHIARKFLCKTSALFEKLGFLKDVTINSNERGWPTFLTGRDASWHGGYYYLPNVSNYSFRGNYDSNDYKCETYFDKMSKRGLKIGLLGIPTTYPPKKINGFVVSNASGGMRPDFTRLVRPSSMIHENRNLFEDFRIDCRYAEFKNQSPEKLINELIIGVEQKTEAAIILPEKYDLDVFMFVHVGPDRLQHLFGSLIINERDSKQDLLELCKLYYLNLDEHIEKLIHFYSDNSLIVLVSDHGFSVIDGYVYLNEILCKSGFAKYRRHKYKQKGINIVKYLLGEKTKKKINQMSPGIVKNATTPLNISESKCFSYSMNGVYINHEKLPLGIVKKRDYDYIIKDLIDALSSIRHPKSGGSLFKNIKRREDVYQGPAIQDAPDVVFEMNGNYQIKSKITYGRYMDSAPKADYKENRLPTIRTGMHDGSTAFGAIGESSINSLDTLQDASHFVFNSIH